MRWLGNLRSNPRRYAIIAAVYYAVLMTLFAIGTDLIRHQKVTRASVILAVIFFAVGGIFQGWLWYRRRMREITEGGIGELVRQYGAEQAQCALSSIESTHTQ